MDYKVYFINALLVRWIPILYGAPVVADALGHSIFQHLQQILGPTAVSGWPIEWVAATLTLGNFIAMDFGLWLAHFVQHRVPALWAFHRVHHSAEVLTPATAYRIHPFDELFSAMVASFTIGVTSGALQYTFGYSGTPWLAFGLNAILFIVYLLGFNLRHSHVWIAYPGWLSHTLISPAQHQIHHSIDPKHWDCNFGFGLAWWDRFAGTLYVPREREMLTFGLNPLSGAGGHHSLRNVYLRPIFDSARNAVKSVRSCVVLVALSSAACAYACSRPEPQQESSSSVFLEELTWNEVKSRIDSGAKTVLVPTGGTEQNGPHMALGKHNSIVRTTSGRIAVELGDTLVAPVIAYSPEGEIEPPTGHMLFTGTLSWPDDVFEAVLEATARSLKLHGFRWICFVGDSGDAQAAQDRVASRLNEEWGAGDVKVVNVSSYYHSNGQWEWLHRQGETRETIGTHAGIRDTSEMLAADPGFIRRDQMAASNGRSFFETGVAGDPSRASREIGVVLLRLKVDAALRQLRELRGDGAVTHRP